MNLTTEAQIKEIILADINRINQRFVREAIQAWDSAPGCVGLFAEYVKRYIRFSWRLMVASN